MTNTNNQQFKSLDSIDFVRDLTPETAANYSGGAVTVTDVTLTSQEGLSFNSNKGIEDLRDFGFNNATAFIAVNNNKTWRFYEHDNFQGDFIEVGPHQAVDAGDFGHQISSFRSVG